MPARFLDLPGSIQKAANQLLDANSTLTAPIYFLFLRSHGLPIVEHDTRKHHRLMKLYEECQSLGLKIGPDDRTDLRNVVGLLEGANEDQGLRYFTMKSSSFPDLKWTREAVESLMRVIEPHVTASDEAAGIKSGVTVLLNFAYSKPVPK